MPPCLGAGPWPAQLLLFPAPVSNPRITGTGFSPGCSHHHHHRSILQHFWISSAKIHLEIKTVQSHLLILKVEPATQGTRALILSGCDLGLLQILCVLLQGSGEDKWNEFDIVPGTGAASLAWVLEGRGWAGACSNTPLISYGQVPIPVPAVGKHPKELVLLLGTSPWQCSTPLSILRNLSFMKPIVRDE